MSETVNVIIAGTPTPIILYDTNTLEAARQAGLATIAADAAILARGGVELGMVNLFDPATIETGWEWLPSGYSEQGNSASSAPIYVKGAKSLVIDGMSPNPIVGNRFGQFLAADKLTPVGSAVFMPTTLNFASMSVPAGAVWFSFTPRQRQTPWPYGYGDIRVYASNAQWADKKIGLIGDSITETEDVDSSQFDYGSDVRSNWPDYAIPWCVPKTVKSYAKSGAHFHSTVALATNQRFWTQVSNLRTEHESSPFDLAVIALGTNDWGNSTTSGAGSLVLGTAASALATDYGSLDAAISCQAMVKGLQDLRYYCPNMAIVGVLPLQRGDFNPTSGMGAWIEEIRTIYKAFGVPVVDCFYESGVVYRFETVSGSGLHLSDKIHPLASGQKLQGRRILPAMRDALSKVEP